jgi:hypothetical protein
MNKRPWGFILLISLSLMSCQSVQPANPELPSPPVTDSEMPPISDREAFADALMAKVVTAINHGDAEFLATYLLQIGEINREFAIAAIADYQTYFKGNEIENYERLGEDSLRPDTLKYRLIAGDIHKEILVSFQQENVTLYDEFLGYSARAKNLLSRFVDALKAGDSQQLAHLLSPDDLDYPVSQAEQAIANYRQAFDPQTLTFEFIGFASPTVANSPFVYRLSGSKAGQAVEHDVKAIYGDSLVGLQDDFVPAMTP